MSNGWMLGMVAGDGDIECDIRICNYNVGPCERPQVEIEDTRHVVFSRNGCGDSVVVAAAWEQAESVAHQLEVAKQKAVRWLGLESHDVSAGRHHVCDNGG
jgi:hypothetical protein